jgi:two-component system chemotaxis response regulator CheB
MSFRSIQAGALELIAKRGSDDGGTADWGDKVVEAVRLMSEVAVVRRHRLRPPIREETVLPRPAGLAAIGIAASTGGPPALVQLLSALPRNYPLPILVAQHIAAGFSVGFAKWLGTQMTLAVEIASAHALIEAGHVYLAPDGHHIEVTARGRLAITPSASGHCPSGNRLFSSLARHYGPAAIGIILTGMGEDGAQGLLELHQTGALTFGQDQPSCVVFGMPQAAAQRNALTELLPLEALRDLLEKLADGGCSPLRPGGTLPGSR